MEDEVSWPLDGGRAERERHEVRLVHVGERVMSAFREFGPQLVVLDVRLGGVRGLDLLNQIKAEAPDTRPSW